MQLISLACLLACVVAQVPQRTVSPTTTGRTEAPVPQRTVSPTTTGHHTEAPGPQRTPSPTTTGRHTEAPGPQRTVSPSTTGHHTEAPGLHRTPSPTTTGRHTEAPGPQRTPSPTTTGRHTEAPGTVPPTPRGPTDVGTSPTNHAEPTSNRPTQRGETWTPSTKAPTSCIAAQSTARETFTSQCNVRGLALNVCNCCGCACNSNSLVTYITCALDVCAAYSQPNCKAAADKFIGCYDAVIQSGGAAPECKEARDRIGSLCGADNINSASSLSSLFAVLAPLVLLF